MSTQGSVFLPSNGANQFQNMVSQSSAPNWAKVSNENGIVPPDSHSRKIMSEINHILSDVRRDATIQPLVDAQTGGKKKASKASKAQKDVKPKKSKSKSKSKSANKLKRSKPKKASSIKKSKSYNKNKPAKVAEKAPSNNKKTKSKSSKQKGGEKAKKEMNPAMKNMRKLADFIKTHIPELKDGAPMTSAASKLIKKHGGLDEAMKEVEKNKSSVKKLYNEIAKEQKENREKKKAAKAAAKSGSSDSQ